MHMETKIRMPSVGTVIQYCSRSLGQCNKEYIVINEMKEIKIIGFCRRFDIHRKLKKIHWNSLRIYNRLQKSERL